MKVRRVLLPALLIAACVMMVALTVMPATVTAQGPVKPPIPYPDPNKISVGGGGAVKPLPIDQIVVYKALPKYHQAPWLDKLVWRSQAPAHRPDRGL